jgi:hypothetical protein
LARRRGCRKDLIASWIFRKRFGAMEGQRERRLDSKLDVQEKV